MSHAPIYHYGNYDARALTKLGKRYDNEIEDLLKRLVNVNKYIYGKVYFPIYSNRLKEIGAFIGATWTAPNASGLQSLVWRHQWDEIRDVEYKDLLLTYNQEDCQTLKLLVDELSKIKYSVEILSNVDFADQPKQRITEIGEEVHSQFEMILKSAHANYDKSKIEFRRGKQKPDVGKKKTGALKRHPAHKKSIPKPKKTSDYSGYITTAEGMKGSPIKALWRASIRFKRCFRTVEI